MTPPLQSVSSHGVIRVPNAERYKNDRGGLPGDHIYKNRTGYRDAECIKGKGEWV